jgi:hypothetical protein
MDNPDLDKLLESWRVRRDFAVSRTTKAQNNYRRAEEAYLSAKAALIQAEWEEHAVITCMPR